MTTLFDAIVLAWLLVGLVAALVVGGVGALSLLFSRGLKRGITTSLRERHLEGLADRKVIFGSILEEELYRRGILMRRPLEKDIDLVYRDFFAEVRIYMLPEYPHLRFGFRINVARAPLILGVLLMIPFLVGSAILFVFAFLRIDYLRESIESAATSAALLSSREPLYYDHVNGRSIWSDLEIGSRIRPIDQDP
jgi:hypothetical protein